jgi:putative addiction module killer protein
MHKGQQLKKLETSEGRIPFDEWYFSLKDKRVRALVAARLLRIRTGNLGDVKSLGQGIFEFRIHFGPGYRIYFGKVNRTIIILLCGGSKNTQKRDIEIATDLWKRYKYEIERFIQDV